MADTEGTKGVDVKTQLLKLKVKCDSLGVTYPRHFCVDDCCAQRNTILSIFPNATVTQDLKHLINRLVEKLSKGSKYYGAATIELHDVFTNGKITVESRNGKLYKIPAPLDEGGLIWGRLQRWKARYNVMAKDGLF